MKQISSELAARLGGEVLTLCLCWKLQRADGAVLGLTEHDRALEVDGVVYEPGAAVEAGTFTQSIDLLRRRLSRRSFGRGMDDRGRIIRHVRMFGLMDRTGNSGIG